MKIFSLKELFVFNVYDAFSGSRQTECCFFLFMYTGEVGEKKNCEKHRGGNEQHFSFSYMFSLQLNAYVSHYTTLHLIDHLIPDCF